MREKKAEKIWKFRCQVKNIRQSESFGISDLSSKSRKKFGKAKKNDKKKKYRKKISVGEKNEFPQLLKNSPLINHRTVLKV